MSSFHSTKSFSFPSPMDRTPNDPCVLISSKNVKKATRNLGYLPVTPDDNTDPNYPIKKMFENQAKKYGWSKVTWYGLSALLQSGATLIK